MTQFRIAVLLPYELDSAPSQRYRWEQWLPHLEAAGMKVELMPCSTPAIGAARRNGAGARGMVMMALRYLPWLTLALWAAWRADIVVVHRNAALSGPPLAEAILAVLGKPIVYDLDDAIYLPPENGDGFWRRLLRCDWRCGYIGSRSVLVGVGNPTLREYMRQFNSNVVLWPTSVDTERYKPREAPEPGTRPIVGWTGSPSTACYLEMILPELARLQSEVDFDFLVIGAQINLARFGVEGRCVSWSAESEIASTRQIDIGLMPLADTAWARGKCALKAIQYHALGSPAVVSDVGVNREVVLDGETGFLVAPGGDWEPPLRRLLGDPALCREMGLRGRAHVEAQYSAKVVGARVARDLQNILRPNC